MQPLRLHRIRQATAMRWLLGTEAGVIIWATLLAAIGAAIRYSEPDDPPEYEPDDTEAQRIAEQFAEDDEAQRIAEQFAEAAAEQDDWHD
jgi:mannitol-1-phosphate/altronate dehydrogenase